MSTVYYTCFVLDYVEQFFHKEFSPKMVIEQLQFCVNNGEIETIGIDETELRANVNFLARMDNGETRYYRFHSGNVVALRRMYRKFSKVSWGI